MKKLFMSIAFSMAILLIIYINFTYTMKKNIIIELNNKQNSFDEKSTIIKSNNSIPITTTSKSVSVTNTFIKTIYFKDNKSLCNETESKLIGPLNTTYPVSTIEDVEKLLENQNINIGGKWSPLDCKPKHHVAILITYLNREEHLKQILAHLHPILARQKLSYGIYLIEPTKGLIFNRGILMNIGFIESNKDSNNLWQCHAYHDVDALAEDDRTMYSCPENPTHLTHAFDKFNYNQPYESYFGGASILRKEQYIKSNGFSNAYYGWGGEDDDLYKRLTRFFKAVHYPPPYNRFKMFKHEQDKENPPNPLRFKLVEQAANRFDKEGLNNVEYKVVSVVRTKLYTKFLVSYDMSKTYT